VRHREALAAARGEFMDPFALAEWEFYASELDRLARSWDI
jgi:hypothetical protein